jgi:hypothetical protein
MSAISNHPARRLPMSSSLHLFDLERHALPLPGTFADLESIRELLHAKKDGKNLRFIEFALGFEDRFPAAPRGRLSLLQQANACRRAAWHFDLPEIDTLRSYQAAVEIAAGLGLVAYDAALGLGFLPDGRVIPTEWQAAPAGDARPDDALRGQSEVREVLAPALARAMAASGFTLEPAPEDSPATEIVLSRQRGPVRQALHVQLGRYERLGLSFRVWHEACSAVFERALGPRSRACEALDLPLDFFAPGPDSAHRWQLERLGELPGVLALVCGRVLPLADLSGDLHGLDQLLNDASAETVRTPYRHAYGWLGRPPGSDGSRSLRDALLTGVQRLVIAHLNGNPAAADIDLWFEANKAQANDAQALRARETLAAVRSALASTPPLAHWPDLPAWRSALRPIPPSLQGCHPDPRGRRCHHWEVTEALHQALSADPASFWARFATPGGEDELRRLWRDKADTLPAWVHVAPDGLECRLRMLPGLAGAGDIEVVCLVFPPISGLEEERVLALARRGEAWRMYRMGHDHMLDNGRMRLRIEYWIGQGGVTGHLVTRETLPHELSVNQFLERLRETFH